MTSPPIPRRRRRRRRATVRIAMGAATLGTLLLLAALAPWIVRGPRLGRVVGWMLPATRGAISVGGGTWSWGAAWSLWRGRPAAFSLDDIRVADPEGTEVLRATRVTLLVELSRDRARLVMRDLRVSGAAWRFAQMKGARDVGFLAAFQPVRRAGARARPRGGGLTSFSIAGAELDGLDVVFEFPAWGLDLRDLRAKGELALGIETQAARSSFTFEVTDADLRGGGQLRVMGGAARVTLPFSAGRIARVATTAAQPQAIQIDASGVATGRSRLALDGAFLSPTPTATPPPTSGVVRARTTGGGIDLRAHLTDATDAIRALLPTQPLARRFDGAAPAAARLAVAGKDARVDLAFSGPFDAIKIEAAARGLDVGARGLEFKGFGFALSAEPALGRARLTGLTFGSPAGGRLTLDAAIDQLQVRGLLAFDHFVTTPYLPSFLRPIAAGALDGRLRATLDLLARSASLDEVALTLARPAGAGGKARADGRALRLTSATERERGSPARAAETLQLFGARFVRGTLMLPTVSAAVAGGRVSARARVELTDEGGRLRPPIFDVDARASRISFERLAGATFAQGSVSFRAHARGTIDALTLSVDVPDSERLRVFGEAFRLPASTVFRFDGAQLAIPEVRLHGAYGSEVAIAGRIGRGGELALGLEVRDFPLGKLPALADSELPLSGRLSGRLQASGMARAPRLAGRLEIDRATFQGRPLGGGALVISPSAGGGIHAAGQVIEGVTVDATMAPLDGGPRGVATMQLRAVRLDPFLWALPGGVRAAGVVSGTIEARVAPREMPELRGRLSELALTISGPAPAEARGGGGGAPASTRPTLELHAVDEVRLSARAGGGPIRIEPAHFAGTPGSVELWGESERGRTRAGARGRLTLGSIAPLLLPWLSHLSGDLAFDVAAETPHADAAPTVTGTVRVATRVSLRVAGFPFDARLASGEIRLGADGVTHLDLPVTVGAGTLRLAGTVSSPARGDARISLDASGDLDAGLLALAAPDAIAWARGGAHLDAHVEGRPQRPVVRARARLPPAAITLALRAAPALPIELGEGQIDLEDHAVTARGLRVRVEGKADATIGADADGAAFVDLGSLFAVRPTRVDLPVRGRVSATTVAPVVIDGAGFILRLDGDLARRTRLSGEITLDAAHVPRGGRPNAARPAAQTAARPGASATSSLTALVLRHPELGRIDLDVHAHSRGGAVTVDVPRLPDVRVDVDYHVRGTPLHPVLSGRLEGAGLYSSFALFLRRIFQ